MGRTSNAARSLGAFRAPPSVAPGVPEPTSGVHMRISPRSSVESFSSWVNEQLVPQAAHAPSAPDRGELESLEEKLLHALQARDIPTALMHACALVYLDPTHQAARRIKKRCMRELRGGRPRTADVPYMRFRWSELRDRELSPEDVCILSCIDGQSQLDDVIANAGMQPADAYDVFAELLSEGIVGMRAPRS